MLLVLPPIRELNLISDSTHTSCLSFAVTSSSTKYQHLLRPIPDLLQQWSLHCIPLHFKNRKPPMYMSHHPAQQTNKYYIPSVHRHESVSIYLYIITMHVSTYLALSPVPTSHPNGFSGFRMPPNMGDQSRLTHHRLEAQSPAPAAVVSPSPCQSASQSTSKPKYFRISIIYSHLMPHHENENNVSIGFHLCLEFLVHKLLARIS